jgi:hypothetical protein
MQSAPIDVDKVGGMRRPSLHRKPLRRSQIGHRLRLAPGRDAHVTALRVLSLVVPLPQGWYNRAQFELFHALGYPAREITYVNPPGTVEPVDTTRPDYLPQLATGVRQQLAETRQVSASGLPCIFDPL